MKNQLITCAKVERERFLLENFLGSDHILILVESGSFRFSHDGKEEIVNKGEAAIFRSGRLYHRKVIEPIKAYLFRFRAESLPFLQDHIIFDDKERIGSTIRLLDRAAGAVGDSFGFFESLFEDIITQYSLERKCIKDKTDEKMEQAISYMNLHLKNKLSMTEIAARVSMSYVHFNRRFTAYTGISPVQYLISARIKKSKELLLNTDLSISDIAEACGFDNQYYFSNTFKNGEGISPSSFRKLIRQ